MEFELTAADLIRFNASRSVGDPDACWLWTGTRVGGYGVLRVRGRGLKAHRIAYALAHGSLQGLCVLHRCDVPACCNPHHLFLGTAADNNADMWRKGRGRPGVLRGAENSRARLSEAQAREALNSTASVTELARRFGVAPCTISNIRCGTNWRHLPRPEVSRARKYLSSEDRDRAVQMRKEGRLLREIADALGISESHACHITSAARGAR